MTSERSTQADIRAALAGRASVYRANVGEGWTGRVIHSAGGQVTLGDARRFSTGLPPGFSDLFGFVAHEVRESDVGCTFARFVALEVKAPDGRPTQQQRDFLRAVNTAGGIGAVVRSPDEALRALSPGLALARDTTELQGLCRALRLKDASALAHACGVSVRVAHGWLNGWAEVHPSAVKLLTLMVKHEH